MYVLSTNSNVLICVCISMNLSCNDDEDMDRTSENSQSYHDVLIYFVTDAVNFYKGHAVCHRFVLSPLFIFLCH